MTEDDTTTGRGSVFRLIYRSQLSVDRDDYRSAVNDILRVARTKNSDLGITGALVVWDDSVVQTLEGDEGAVRGLYETISHDPRHERIELVEESPNVERMFAKWSMAQVSEDEAADLPFRNRQWEGGIDVEGYKALVSPEQEAIITRMREKIRGTPA